MRESMLALQFENTQLNAKRHEIGHFWACPGYRAVAAIWASHCIDLRCAACATAHRARVRRWAVVHLPHTP